MECWVLGQIGVIWGMEQGVSGSTPEFFGCLNKGGSLMQEGAFLGVEWGVYLWRDNEVDDLRTEASLCRSPSAGCKPSATDALISRMGYASPLRGFLGASWPPLASQLVLGLAGGSPELPHCIGHLQGGMNLLCQGRR